MSASETGEGGRPATGDGPRDEATIRATVVSALAQVAPDIDPASGDPAANLFDEFDIDSIDFLHLITRLAERHGVPMPERDYPLMQSVDALVGYLAGALGERDTDRGHAPS